MQWQVSCHCMHSLKQHTVVYVAPVALIKWTVQQDFKTAIKRMFEWPCQTRHQTRLLFLYTRPLKTYVNKVSNTVLEMLILYKHEFGCFIWKANTDTYLTCCLKCYYPDILQHCFNNFVFGFWLPVRRSHKRTNSWLLPQGFSFPTPVRLNWHTVHRRLSVPGESHKHLNCRAGPSQGGTAGN